MGGKSIRSDGLLQHLKRLLSDFGADSVAADDGESRHVVGHAQNHTRPVHNMIHRFTKWNSRLSLGVMCGHEFALCFC